MAHLQLFRRQPIAFLTAATFNRRPLLDRASSHEVLRRIWERSTGRNGWYVSDYVLMPDYVRFPAQAASESRSRSAHTQSRGFLDSPTVFPRRPRKSYRL